MPEGRIPLAECTVYLATSPKSNSAYKAINEALAYVRRTGNLPVPLHLRNAPTQLMEQMGYGKDYRYPPDFAGPFVRQQYKPDAAQSAHFCHAQDNPSEDKMQAQMQKLWGPDNQ